MAIWMSSIACSHALPHDFDPRKAHDHPAQQATIPSNPRELEMLAVVLVPSNTTLSQVPMQANWNQNYVDDFYAETYVGPVRLFLRPGKRPYKLGVETSDGVVELEIEVEVEAGKRYELAIVEDGYNVRFDLFELHESSYAALYPND